MLGHTKFGPMFLGFLIVPEEYSQFAHIKIYLYAIVVKRIKPTCLLYSRRNSIA